MHPLQGLCALILSCLSTTLQCSWPDFKKLSAMCVVICYTSNIPMSDQNPRLPEISAVSYFFLRHLPVHWNNNSPSAFFSAQAARVHFVLANHSINARKKAWGLPNFSHVDHQKNMGVSRLFWHSISVCELCKSIPGGAVFVRDKKISDNVETCYIFSRWLEAHVQTTGSYNSQQSYSAFHLMWMVRETSWSAIKLLTAYSLYSFTFSGWCRTWIQRAATLGPGEI